FFIFFSPPNKKKNLNDLYSHTHPYQIRFFLIYPENPYCTHFFPALFHKKKIFFFNFFFFFFKKFFFFLFKKKKKHNVRRKKNKRIVWFKKVRRNV
ncbi:hypothetical protein DUI37_28660, partial [Bacillus anthracis]